MPRSHVILTIFRKEALELSRNRAALLLNYGLPLLLYPLLLVFFGEASELRKEKDRSEGLGIAMLGTKGEALRQRLVESGLTVTTVAADAAQELEALALETLTFGPVAPERRALGPAGDRLRKQLRDRKITALLYTRPWMTRENGAPENLEVHLLFDRTRDTSMTALESIGYAFDRYRQELRERRLSERGLPAALAYPILLFDTELAGQEQAIKESLSGLIPYLVFLFLCLATFYPALEVFTGERDRGTLVPLLSTPATPDEIVIAKGLTIYASAIVSLMSHWASVGILMLVMPKQEGAMSLASVPFGTLMPLVTSAAATLTALSLAAIVLAKRKEEGQGILTFLLFLTMAPVLFSSVADMKLTWPPLFVPLMNTSLLIKESLRESLSWAHVGTAMVVNIAAAIGLGSFAVHLFSRETVQFRDDGSLGELLAQRSGAPRPPTAGLSLFAFGLLLLPPAYLGPAASRLSPPVATALLQLLGFLGIPLALAWAFRIDWRTGFGLRLPRWQSLLGAALLGLSTPIAIAFVQSKFPLPQRFLEEFARSLGLDDPTRSKAMLFVAFALLPAVCEEVAYRGLILNGLRTRLSSTWAVVLTSLAFGLAHFSAFRFLPTAVTGLMLGTLAVRSGSLLPGIAAHGLHNGSLLAMGLYPALFAPLGLSPGVIPVPALLVALAGIATGLWLARR